MHRYRRGAAHTDPDRVVQRRAAPGKRSGTLQLKGAAELDLDGTHGLLGDRGNETGATGAAAGHDDPFALHLLAEEGVGGTPAPLPHLDAIQRSFGPDHDLSRVGAHVGGAATVASDAIGARAYATGSRVAFREAPDLFTAAHEAAHVVQQGAGVHLAGGIGAEGDPYEQHADAVAERVVRGESAADLLAPYAGRTIGADGGGVQRAVQRLSAERAFAVAEMDKIKADLAKLPGQTASSVGGDGTFTKHTHITQQVLRAQWHPDQVAAEVHQKQADGTPLNSFEQTFIQKWDAGKWTGLAGYSSCMEFTGAFAESKLKLDGAFRRFDLDTYAPESWVEAGPGRFPKEGDLVRTRGKLMHVTLSYNAPTEGGTWEVIESGQGTIGTFDSMKANTRTYNTGDILGWMDIDKRATHDFGAKLVGTWETVVNGEKWLYTFPSGGNDVHYIHVDNTYPPGKGTWEPGGDSVLLHFSGIETWPLAGVKSGHGTSGSDTFTKLSASQAIRRELECRKWQVKAADGSATWMYTFAGNTMHWENAAQTERGDGTWSASGRHVTLRWKSGTVETWILPSPIGYLEYSNKGMTYGVTPL